MRIVLESMFKLNGVSNYNNSICSVKYNVTKLYITIIIILQLNIINLIFK